MPIYEGSCLCGQVRYRIEGEQLAFYHCHCSRCRKMNGTGHASNLRIAGNNIEWLSGEELMKRYKVPEAERFRNDFCGHCGSPMPRHFPQHQMIVLPAGTLDSELEAKPEARIFNQSRASWSCEDQLPVFAEYPK